MVLSAAIKQVRYNLLDRLIVGTQTPGFGSPHARNGRLAAVTRNITVGVRGNDAQRAKA